MNIIDKRNKKFFSLNTKNEYTEYAICEKKIINTKGCADKLKTEKITNMEKIYIFLK